MRGSSDGVNKSLPLNDATMSTPKLRSLGGMARLECWEGSEYCGIFRKRKGHAMDGMGGGAFPQWKILGVEREAKLRLNVTKGTTDWSLLVAHHKSRYILTLIWECGLILEAGVGGRWNCTVDCWRADVNISRYLRRVVISSGHGPRQKRVC